MLESWRLGGAFYFYFYFGDADFTCQRCSMQGHARLRFSLESSNFLVLSYATRTTRLLLEDWVYLSRVSILRMRK